MPKILLLNKPFNVLCQFTDDGGRQHLGDFINDEQYKRYYAAGRLDRDSEGLVLLTDNGPLQNHIAHPRYKMPKTYWVQVEGAITDEALSKLKNGIELKDGMTKPAQAQLMDSPNVWEREPPIRERKNIPTSWIELSLTEGRNRQVRRMTAATGFPTLRLIRYCIGEYSIADLQPGEYTSAQMALPLEAGVKTEAKKTKKKPFVKKAQCVKNTQRVKNTQWKKE